MRLRVRVSPAARSDIAETFSYIAAESGRPRAVRWRSGLIATLKSLGEMPLRHPLAAEEELALIGVRQLVHLSHRVLYSVGEEVQILRIPHVRRDQFRPEDLP